MPSTKDYRRLHDQVTARPGAADRLAALREETLDEIGLFELRKALGLSQNDIANALDVSQAAVSQLERSGDLRVSTLRRYLAGLGAELHLVAVFGGDDAHAVELRVGSG